MKAQAILIYLTINLCPQAMKHLVVHSSVLII